MTLIRSEITGFLLHLVKVSYRTDWQGETCPTRERMMNYRKSGRLEEDRTTRLAYVLAL